MKETPEITCPKCDRKTPDEKYQNRCVDGWHYYCVHCRHHWTPKEKEIKTEVRGMICRDEQFHIFFDLIVDGRKLDVSIQAHKETVQEVLDDNKPKPHIKDLTEEYFLKNKLELVVF